MRWFAGVRQVDIPPNGVDARYYSATSVAEKPGTVVFWGRLDFGPNIQALEWFCPGLARVIRARPDARFTIGGFEPTAGARLTSRPGIELVRDARDSRPIVEAVGRRLAVHLWRRHQEQAARSGGDGQGDRLYPPRRDGPEGHARSSDGRQSDGMARCHPPPVGGSTGAPSGGPVGTSLGRRGA